ncbi:MAG: hypothetical protein ACT4PY_03080 [Armatimonadota bacterium]
MTTRYHPRTDVERWQLQDRLTQRLRQMGYEGRPRFFEAGGGGLAFRLWLGWRPATRMLAGLTGVDEHDSEAGGTPGA